MQRRLVRDLGAAVQQMVANLDQGSLAFGPPGGVALGPLPLPELGDGMRAQSDPRQDRPDQQGDGHEAGGRRPSPGPLQPPLPEGGPPGPDRPVREVAIQVVRQRLSAGIATMGRLGQALQADRLQVARDLELELRWRHRLLLEDLDDGLHRRRPFERRPAGEHLVEDRSQGIDVGRGAHVLGLPSGLLGRDVAGRAQDLSGFGGSVLLQVFGQAEIRDLESTVPGEKDIRWLEVAMHDASLMRSVYRPGKRRGHRRGRPPKLRTAAQGGGETAPLQQLERNVRQAPDLTDVVDLDDIRMA